MRETYDYVIVGAGSAGSVLAARLSQNERCSVLLLESGPDGKTLMMSMPRGIARLMADPDAAHYWKYNVSQGGNRPQEVWVKGRAMGGSSAVNGMVYVRGAPADYDGWAQAGCPGWGWSEIGRCFVAMERHELGAGLWRGGAGPLRVSLPPARGGLAAAVVAAAAQAGTPPVEDINDPLAVREGGFGWQPRTIWKGRRVSAADAFLAPARRRRNLDVVAGAEVEEILFAAERAAGVTFNQGGAKRRVMARAEVILCAGAINSPKLLQLSGIGPGALLQGLGIPVRVDAPEVGRNLLEHRTFQIVYRLVAGGHNADLRGPGLWRSVAAYMLARRGALSDAVFELGGFVKTLPGLDRPDGQVGVGLFSFGPDGIERVPGLTMYGHFLRPESRGELAIVSPDPRRPPRIDANFMAAMVDRVHTVSLFRYMRRIAAQPALAPFIRGEVTPGLDCESDEDIVEASFLHGTTGYHVAGTCRMGSDPGAVLDPALRVQGVAGLRVADTSVMPSMVSGNTNAPAMAIGWRAAELIRGS